jgi:acyl carrier protein
MVQSTNIASTGAPSAETLAPDELELARLIVSALNLETPAEGIEPEAALYRDGLGLDSIDILEMSMAISNAYGIKLRSDDPDNGRIFRSLRSLNGHVQAHRTK